MQRMGTQIEKCCEDMEEIWKDIEGYEGIYQVSNFGRAKSLGRVIDTKNGRTTVKGVIMSPCGKPYLFVYLNKNHKSKYHAVHRLVAQAFIPNLENKPQVNHIDGNKTNNAVSNLEWVTQSENMLHAYRIGLEKSPKGRHNYWSEKKTKAIHLNGIELLFNSVTECSKALGIGKRRIRYLRQYGKTSASGYRFEYA